MPRISVIVPIYKVELYLRRCVDSILSQTFSDFEVILVDDGSPDNCPAICDEYAEKDNRVKVIHQQNGGLSAARNAGIDWAFLHSNSEWLGLVDGDDWIHPRFLEYLYQAASEGNVEIAVCNGMVASTVSDYQALHLSYEIKNADQFHFDNRYLATIAWNKLYAKNLFTDYRYPVGKIHEDTFLTYKLLHLARTIAWINLPLYMYFQRETSIMGTFTPKRFDWVDAMLEQCEFYKTIDDTMYTASLCEMFDVFQRHLHTMSSMPEFYTIYISRQKQLRRLILKHKKLLPLSFTKTPDILDAAYPKLTRLYAKIQRVKNRFTIHS